MLVFAQKSAPVYPADVLNVNDGDTVTIAAPYLPQPLKPQIAVRIYGVDTPEKGYRAKCATEDALGKSAAKFTRTQIANAKIKQVVFYEWDKYGGRVLGDIILDGVSLRRMLIESGYARAYDGKKKSDWCK